MKTALLHETNDLRTFVLVLGSGDETMSALAAFAAENRLKASQFSAIGAFERAVVAYFEWESKRYRHIPLDEQVEVLSMRRLAASQRWPTDIDSTSRCKPLQLVLGRLEPGCSGEGVRGHARNHARAVRRYLGTATGRRGKHEVRRQSPGFLIADRYSVNGA